MNNSRKKRIELVLGCIAWLLACLVPATVLVLEYYGLL